MTLMIPEAGSSQVGVPSNFLFQGMTFLEAQAYAASLPRSARIAFLQAYNLALAGYQVEWLGESAPTSSYDLGRALDWDYEFSMWDPGYALSTAWETTAWAHEGYAGDFLAGAAIGFVSGYASVYVGSFVGGLIGGPYGAVVGAVVGAGVVWAGSEWAAAYDEANFNTGGAELGYSIGATAGALYGGYHEVQAEVLLETRFAIETDPAWDEKLYSYYREVVWGDAPTTYLDANVVHWEWDIKVTYGDAVDTAAWLGYEMAKGSKTVIFDTPWTLIGLWDYVFGE